MDVPGSQSPMDISVEAHKRYCRASSAYRDLDALRNSTGIWDASSHDHVDTCNDAESSVFTTSPIVNEVADGLNGSDGTSGHTWRIDGAEDFGQHLLVVPVFPNISIQPLFIDVFVELGAASGRSGEHTALDLAACAHTRHEGVSKTGLSRVVQKLLGRWSEKFSDVARLYNDLPFGTRLCIDQLRPPKAQNGVRILPSGYAHLLQDLKGLASSIGLDVEHLPRTVSVSELSIVRRCGEAVSIVTEASSSADMAIFKACVTTPQQLYHELSILLRLQDSSSAPQLLGIVTVDNDNIRGGVVGFLLRYYPGGNLSRLLPTERASGSGGVAEKSSWGLQLSIILRGLLYKHGHFYAELKTENIVVSDATSGPRSLILIDYEQNGASNAWSPPEVIHAERIFSLLKGNIDTRACESYARLLGVLLCEDKTLPEWYRKLDRKAYRVWDAMSTKEADAAMVFMLGKVLYCMFESTSCVTSLLAQSFPVEPDIEFPEFCRTPLPWRELILRCTAGARERVRKNDAYIQRHGNIIVPGNRTGTSNSSCTRLDTIEATRKMWLAELQEMEAFVRAKERYAQGIATESDMSCLHYLQRPCLSDVINCIEQIRSGEAPLQ
jgi:hypothetical protein